MNHWSIDTSWCLFLDRDGVINTRKFGGYIEHVDEFEFINGSDIAIAELSQLFQHTFVVTNQQGIGKGIMTEGNLSEIHRYMCAKIEELGGKIDCCYFAPDLASPENQLRKPNTGMGIAAKRDFPTVNFQKSVMVGDSDSDIEFGTRLGMKTVRILYNEEPKIEADLTLGSLAEFKKWILGK